MTPQEAIDRINLLIGTEKLFIKISTMGEISHSQNIEALEMAKQAVEKQIPKKAKNITTTVYYKQGRCPNCNALLKNTINIFCSDCGQALDWSDEE